MSTILNGFDGCTSISLAVSVVCMALTLFAMDRLHSADLNSMQNIFVVYGA
jgi:hypothetical protein